MTIYEIIAIVLKIDSQDLCSVFIVLCLCIKYSVYETVHGSCVVAKRFLRITIETYGINSSH